MGHTHQHSFFSDSTRYRFAHGGDLRKRRRGRGQRPLSIKEPLHCVFKLDKSRLKSKSLRSSSCFRLTHFLIRKYAQKFFVKIEHLSIQNNHIHLLIRTSRRSRYHFFFRVLAGQIAQTFEKEGLLVTDTPARARNGGAGRGLGDARGTKLWLRRPFSRVVRGYRGYRIVMDYIQLNEKEALGAIPYRAERLKGLSMGEWAILWA